MMPRANLMHDFAILWRAIDGEPYSTEYRFNEARRWRFDVAWPTHRVAVELEGGTWRNGRHTRPSGFQGDCEKYNRAVESGWHVLRYTSDDLRKRSVETLNQIVRVLNERRCNNGEVR